MEYARLEELIACLEAGTQLHICVVFLEKQVSCALRLEPPQRIHMGAICHEMKSRPGGLNRCFRCRNAALKKAVNTGKPFAGICINGIYEYVRPVVKDGKVICVIFVGNILPPTEQRDRLLSRIGEQEALLDSLEARLDPSQCEVMGGVVESYIRMLTVLEPVAQRSTEKSALIEAVKSYVHENLSYDVSLPLLAQMLHYNEKYLGRQFKAQVGVSFAEYLNRARVEQARELLLRTDADVIDIAMRTGFRNVSYFNRIFKRCFGITPREVRMSK